MKKRALLVVAAYLFFVVFGGAADPTEELKKEKDKLKGTWSLVSSEPPAKELQGTKMIFEEDTVTFKSGIRIELVPATYKLDPSKNPKELDITVKDRVIKGIYVLDGDTLKLCNSDKGDRPKEFKADKESRTGIVTLRRDKN